MEGSILFARSHDFSPGTHSMLRLVLLCCPQRAGADKLQITSTPPSATMELDGLVAGTTPFEKDFPGGYSLLKTRKSMGSRPGHPVVARSPKV